MDYQSIITIEPGKRGGKPCIRGLRITVYDVLGWLASGMTPAEIIEDFPELTHEDMSDSEIWAYAREHDFIIVSKDSDFVDWSALSGQPPKVILLKTGNQPWRTTAQMLIDHREQLESALITANAAGVDLY